MEVLEQWYSQISSFEKLKITEAQELYKKAINTQNISLKETYINELILGTLYVVPNYIARNNLSTLSSRIYDINDIINTIN